MKGRKRQILWVAAIAGCLASVAAAGPPEKWLHVRVDDAEKNERVRVNVPLSLAEKVLPTINQGDLHNGKIAIKDADLNGVDLRALLQAVQTTPDGEFVTVEGRDEHVRVAKMGGTLVAHITGAQGRNEAVDVTVPMGVVNALIADNKELDVLAAVRVLETLGDTTLVTVKDAEQTVRIWVDSRNGGN